MLSSKDKEFIRQIIREELKEALTAFLVREITVEKGPRKQGDPEKTIEKEEWNVLDFLCYYLPLLEGSNRGLQSDVNIMTNKSQLVANEMNVISNALIAVSGLVESPMYSNKKQIEEK